MPFDYRDTIVYWEPHGDREENKEHPHVFNKTQESATVYFFKGKPIANKEYQGADHEETHHDEVIFQMCIFIFNVQHGYAQNCDYQDTQEHSTV